MKNELVNTDNDENLIDELHTLLKNQIQMLRNSKYQKFEKLIEQSNAIIAEITKNPSLLTPELKNRARQIDRLYREIELIIESEKSAVDKQLQKLTFGKRTIRAYQNR